MIHQRLLAQIYNPVLTIPGTGGEPGEMGDVGLAILIARLFRTLVMVGGLALLIYIIFGGLSWITAGGDEKSVEQAKDRITNGIVGMAVLVGAMAIATLVGNALGVDLLNPTLKPAQ